MTDQLLTVALAILALVALVAVCRMPPFLAFLLVSIAVALRYDPSTMDEPRITGLGSEREGKRLMAWARRSAIEVVTSESLAEALFRDSSVGQSIPPSRFRAVAELLRQLRVQTPGSKRLRAAG
jgi:flagellar biosynthesis protein FlhB